MRRPGMLGLLLGAGVGFGVGLLMIFLGSFGTMWQALFGEGSWASDFIIAPVPAIVLGGAVGLVVGMTVGKLSAQPEGQVPTAPSVGAPASN